MKKLLLISFFSALFVFLPSSASAEPDLSKPGITRFKDGSYFETIISDESSVIQDDTQSIPRIKHISSKSTKTTRTKSKSTYYKNSSGKILWYVKVTGTFTYGHGSSVCTNAAVTAASKSSSWKIYRKSAAKSHNKASAYATGVHYYHGISAESTTKTVTLTCSPTGVFY